MARSRASVALSEPEFDEAWPSDIPLRSVSGHEERPYDPRDRYRGDEHARSNGRGVAGRRTVTIRGQVPARPPQRRPARDRYAGTGSRPDRIAMWAVLLGLLLVLVAATSSHAAVMRVSPRAAQTHTKTWVATASRPRARG